jgi:hypothetical protein
MVIVFPECHAQELMPIISATEEVNIGRIMV